MGVNARAHGAHREALPGPGPPPKRAWQGATHMAAQGCGVARRHSAGAVVLVFIVGQQPHAHGRALDAGSN